ncbi:MAG: cytochrome c family protein [Variibacter sp.]|nr:cytochrome c family protein [Variibacter sp.]
MIRRAAATTVVLALAAVFVSASGRQGHAQDLSAGANAFKKCQPCHAVGEGAANKVGPTLNGLEGRRAGSVEGYSYSEANKRSGIVWNEQTFKEYIQNPRAVIPGTKMIFAGIKNETEIANLWAYLKQFGPDGKTK